MRKRLIGGSTLAIIDVIRKKVRDGEYEFAVPHFIANLRSLPKKRTISVPVVKFAKRVA